MENTILEILPMVENPARYLGKEINSYHKEVSKNQVKFALCYPDIYEIGMSSLGIRILYGLLNEIKNVVCERVFSPGLDMENILREKKIPLFTLESKTPVKNFDFFGFSLSSELNYTNFLNLLDLAHIPIFAKDRKEHDPFVIIGGNCVFNPIPLSHFADLFVIGEGEEVVKEIVDCFSLLKGKKRKEILENLSNIEGVFVPEFPKEIVRKRFVKDLNKSFFPSKWLVPLTEIVHDRISVEIMRGCNQGCKFCQAGRCWKPVRHRDKEKIIQITKDTYSSSGYEEISLLSFSSGDHFDIEKIVEELVNMFKEKKVSISFPSLKIDTFSFKLANKIKEIKKTGLTFAPETSERLRYKMGKKIKNENLIELAIEAKKAGWRQIKLYFMIGLPGEKISDIEEIGNFIKELSKIVRIKVSFNTFIPKPHTFLGKERFISKEEFEEKKRYLIEKLNKNRYIKMFFHPYEMSCVETFLGRGDEKLNDIIYHVWNMGGKMENWKEHFNFSLWEKAFEKENLNLNSYLKEKTNEKLPWEFMKI